VLLVERLVTSIASPNWKVQSETTLSEKCTLARLGQGSQARRHAASRELADSLYVPSPPDTGGPIGWPGPKNTAPASVTLCAIHWLCHGCCDGMDRHSKPNQAQHEHEARGMAAHLAVYVRERRSHVSRSYIRIRATQRDHTAPHLKSQVGPYLGKFHNLTQDTCRPASRPSCAASHSIQFQHLESLVEQSEPTRDPATLLLDPA
jgi:hypothetical protein